MIARVLVAMGLASALPALPVADGAHDVRKPPHVGAGERAASVSVHRYPERGPIAYVIVDPKDHDRACITVMDRPNLSHAMRAYLPPHTVEHLRIENLDVAAKKLIVSDVVVDADTLGARAVETREVALARLGGDDATPVFGYRTAAGEVHVLARAAGSGRVRDDRNPLPVASDCAHAEVILRPPGAQGGSNAEIDVTTDKAKSVHVSASISRTTRDKEPVVSVVVDSAAATE